MRQRWKRLLAGVLTAALLVAVLPTQAMASLLENSRDQNEYILEQLQGLWGDEATAEQAMALLRQYGLIDSRGNVITDWSGELCLEEEPRPLTLAEAAALGSGSVTVNGHAAQARDVAEALSQLERLGLFDGAALTADWQLAVDGAATAPADYAAVRSSWEAPGEAGESSESAPEEPAREGEGLLAAVGRALSLSGPEGPSVTVLGAQVSDPDALEELIAQLDQWGVLTGAGTLTDWALTAPGERRQVTMEELTAMAEAGEAGDDTVVLVDGTPISLGDLRLLLAIEAELRRIEETYFQEEVELTTEQAEGLVSIYEQLLADGGFTLYSTNAADDLTADDFPSGVDQTVVVSAEVSAAAMGSDCTVTVKLDKAQPEADVAFSWRAFDGSVTVTGAAEGAGVIPAGETETTFTVQVGQAAGKLDDGGQGAFAVQIYDVKNALFDNGRDSWTGAVRVQGRDALKYYEEQSAAASKTDRNGIAAAASMSSFGAGWALGTGNEGQILTGTSNHQDQDVFRNWQSSGMPSQFHDILNHTFPVEGLSAGAYTITLAHSDVPISVPGDAKEYFPIMPGNPSVMQQTAKVGYSVGLVATSATMNSVVREGVTVTLNRNIVSASIPEYDDAVASYESDGSTTLSVTIGLTTNAFGFNAQNLDYLFFLPESGDDVQFGITLQENTTSVTPTLSAPDIAFTSGETVPITVDFGYPVILDAADTITVNGKTLQPVETGVATTHATYLYEVPKYGYASLTLEVVPATVTGANQRELAVVLDKPGENYGEIGVATLDIPRLTDAVGSWTADVTGFTYTAPGDGAAPYTAAVVDLTMEMPEETTFRELLGNYYSSEESGAGTLYSANLALSIDGGATPLPIQVREENQTVTALTARIEIDVATLEDPTQDLSFVAELYKTERDESDALVSQELLFGHYISCDVDAPTPLTAADIAATAPDTWPTENVFVNDPPEGLQLSASVTGTGYTWTQLRWYSDNEDVARIDPTTGEVTLYGTGTANFYIRAVNGGLSAYRDGDEDAPYAENGTYSKKVASLTVGEGDAPYLRIPEDEITVRAGDDVTLRWAGNLVQKNMQYSGGNTPTTFTIQVYEGGTDADEQPAGEPIQTVEFTYDPSYPGAAFPNTDLPMWSGEGESLTPIQSYTLTGLDEISSNGQPSYTLVLTAGTTDAVPGGAQTFTDCATVTVVSRPVTVALERPDSFYLVNQGTLDLSYVLTDYDVGNNAQFKLTVTDNSTGEAVVSLDETEAEGGTFSIDLAGAETGGFRAIYDVSLQAKNTAEPDWSRDSFTLYIYDKDCLDLVVKEIENGRVVVDGDHVSMSNEAWIASLSQDEILALNREIDLQTAISINQDRAWGEASDRMEWSSHDSSVAAVNYQQGTYYENIENLTYSSYAPATEFLLSGRNDGTTVVEAIHALVGDNLSSSVTVDVNTLKDKLYLFQFFPAGRAELTYTNGAGERKEGVPTADDGRAAVYEPTGIASDVYVKAEINGEVYLGTVYQEDLVSQEKDAVTLELYPLNSLTLRKAASLPLYLKGPDGLPYSGEVTVRVGVYRNGVYCADALYHAETGANSKDDTEDDPVITPEVVTTRGDADHVVTFDAKKGAATFYFDLTQFNTNGGANPVTAADDIRFVLELRAGDGTTYYPVFFDAYGSLNEEDAVRLADRVVNLEYVPADQVGKPFVGRQAIYFSGKESGMATNVRNQKGNVGPSADYPNPLLTTTTLWWGEDMDVTGRSLRFVDDKGTAAIGQTVQADRYPFFSMPVVHHTMRLDEDQLDALSIGSMAGRGMQLEYIDTDGTVRKKEEMPWTFVNALALGKTTESDDLYQSIKQLNSLINSNTSGGISVGSDFLTKGMALVTQSGISIPGISLTLAPTADPTVFRAMVSIGLNNMEGDNVSGVDADGERGSDLDAMPDMDAIKSILGDGPSKYADSAGKMAEDASRILKNNMRQGSGTSKTGDHALKYALQGWFETEVSYNFETQKWDFIILTGGFTAGGGMGYEWTWNMQVGPVPLFFQLEAGASGAVQFNAALWEKGNVRANDYLTELRLYAYLQAFGGIGFDYAIIALKLGLYGRVGLTAQLRWLNTAEPVNIGGTYGTSFAGQYLDVDGEVGAKFQVELLFISYEKILWSQPIQFYEGSFNDWKEIDAYWENTKKGIGNGSFIHPEEETPSTRALSQPNLLMADSSGMGIYYADREPALLDRDYLERYDRTYDTSGPSLGGGFQLFGLLADGDAGPVVETLGNSYTQAAPSLTDDGGYLFYLDDLNDSGDATKVRAAVMTRNGTGYDSENPVIFGGDDDSGYGDSGLNASGSGSEVAAVWSRVMAEPAITEPGQAVTSDIQADMMNNSHIFVAVPGDGGWKVTNLTENSGGGNLAPVVARKGDHILVAWRQVTSTTADVTDFNARDYIYCAVSGNGGETWTKPTPIYNGTSGAVKGLEAAMLPDGAAAVAFTLQGEDHDIAEGIYDQNVAYAIVGSETSEDNMADVQRYVVLEEAALAENPQMAAVKLDAQTNAFVLGWYSLDPDTQAGDIRLAAMDESGNRITGFVDALSDLIRNSETAVSADFQFVQNANALDELSILWSGAAEEMAETTTEDGTAAGAEGVDAFGCVSGLRLRTVDENGTPKVSVTAAQRLVEMAPNTTVDSFTAYVDGGGTLYLASQGTYYDEEHTEEIEVAPGQIVKLPSEKTSIYTMAAAYTDAAMRVDSLLPDYPNIRKGAQVPVQITLTNLGTQPMTELTVEIGENRRTFRAGSAFVPIEPGETRTVTVQYTVPTEGAIPNPDYTITGTFGESGLISRLLSGNQTEAKGTVAMNVPDLGIADTDILLDAADGKRILQVTLYNRSDAALAGSDREVQLAFFSDSGCTEQIDNKYFTEIATLAEGEPLKTVTGEDLEAVDDGSYTIQYAFDIQRYIDDLKGEDGSTPLKDEDGEIRDAGVTIYVKAWVQLPAADGHEAGEMQEFNTTNNTRSIHMESLLKQANGQPVTQTYELAEGDGGGTDVTVTLRNNSIQDSQNGNLIVTLYDSQGNKVGAQQSYEAEGGLVTITPEGTYQHTFHFDQPGVRAEVTYGTLVLEGNSAQATNLVVRDIATLQDFTLQEDGTYTASAQVSYMSSTWVDVTAADPASAVTVNGTPMELGGIPFDLNRGENVITILITSGSETARYVLTVQNEYTKPGGGGGSNSGVTYPVDVPDQTEHGAVTVKPGRAEKGDTVTITARPDAGYRVGEVTVTDKNGDPVKVTGEGGIYTFTMPGGRVSVNVTFVPEEQWSNPFADVSADAWYYDAVKFVNGNGLMAGTGGSTFSPDLTTTRGMIVTILYRMEGAPDMENEIRYNPFKDVDASAWYAAAVCWARRCGIVTGYSDELFGPNDTITREQMAVILYRYAQYKGYDTASRADLSGYTDAAQVSSWAEDAIRWANAEGLVNGTSGTTLSPQGSATRAQAAMVLTRFCRNVAD